MNQPGHLLLLRIAITPVLLVVGCGRLNPIEDLDRVLPHERLEGMYLHVLAWPETLSVGQLGTAEAELLLADGTPFPADLVQWSVDSVRIAELYPYDKKEAKRVRAVQQGTATITVSAFVRKNYNSREVYRADMINSVVVIP